MLTSLTVFYCRRQAYEKLFLLEAGSDLEWLLHGIRISKHGTALYIC